MSNDQRAHVYNLVLGAAVVVVLAATLYPVESDKAAGYYTCLVCGARGSADALRNAVLFMPLGAALALSRRRVLVALLLAALLSASIELTQLLLPGRHATLGDLLFNALGAGFGICAVRWFAVWSRPRRQVAAGFTISATALALLTLALTGYLLQPAFPASTYYGQWTPDLGHLEWYRGRVLEFTIGEEAIPGGRRVTDSERLRSRLENGAALRALALAGPRTERLGSLVSIYDHRYREIILVGPDRDDLVYRYRMRAADWRLDRPDLRLRNALAGIRAGDTLRVSVEPTEDGYCMTLNQTVSCDMGFTAGNGWSLVYYSDRFPEWFASVLTVVWLVVLAMPAAFWAKGRGMTVSVALALCLGLALVPEFTGLLSTSPLEYAAAGVGISAGLYLRRRSDSHGLPAPGKALGGSEELV